MPPCQFSTSVTLTPGRCSLFLLLLGYTSGIRLNRPAELERLAALKIRRACGISRVAGTEASRESGCAERRADRVLQEFHHHRRPCAAAILFPPLDERLLHHSREP